MGKKTQKNRSLSRDLLKSFANTLQPIKHKMTLRLMPQKQYIALTALVGNSLRGRFIEMGSMVGMGNCQWFRINFFEAFNCWSKPPMSNCIFSLRCDHGYTAISQPILRFDCDRSWLVLTTLGQHTVSQFVRYCFFYRYKTMILASSEMIFFRDY